MQATHLGQVLKILQIFPVAENTCQAKIYTNSTCIAIGGFYSLLMKIKKGSEKGKQQFL